MTIREIVQQTIDQFLIQETVSQVIYHFTNVESLLSIIQTDTFILTPSLYGDNLKKGYFFFMSFTRQKNGNLGYSREKDVRIYCDGNLLNQKYKGGPVNFWKNRGKYRYYTDHFKTNGLDDEGRYQQFTENEDRIFSNSSSIPNANKYITHIDILWDGSKAMLENIYIIMSNYSFRNKLSIYTNENDFRQGNNKTIKIDLPKNYTAPFLERETISSYDIAAASEIVAYALFVYNITELNARHDWITLTFKKLGIDRYSDLVIRKVDKMFSSHFTVGRHSLTQLNDLIYPNCDIQLYAAMGKIVKLILSQTSAQS